MGQRHQIFIVARVAPQGSTVSRYRCVGAYHHQWFVPTAFIPLEQLRKFLYLIQEEDNVQIVKEEIRAIQGKYGSGDSEPKFPAIPCPYTTFLLASAFCIDLEPPQYYTTSGAFRYRVLSATMGSTEGDNNDGITVIDITDPTNPSYCLVRTFRLSGQELEVTVEQRVPLTAEQYAAAYSVPAHNIHVQSLRDERLMTLDVLAEAWPTEYTSMTTTSAVEDAAPVFLPSLADLALKPAVEHSLQTGETEELEGLVWHPGKAKHMLSILQCQHLFPDSGLSLLAKVLQHEAGSDKISPDLSSLSLSGSQVVALLTLLKREDVEILDLSHNHNITIDGLRQVLATSTKLRRLVLLDTSIANEDIHKLLIDEPKLFYAIEELVHPAFLSGEHPTSYPNRFAFVELNMQYAAATSLAIFTPATVIQSLTDYLSPTASNPDFGIWSSLMAQAAFASGIRGEGESWTRRRVHCFPSLMDNPFDEPGWLFASSFYSERDSISLLVKRHQYGFVSIDATVSGEKPRWRICDLETFLKETALEGRPPPSDHAVKKLEGIFADLEAKGAKIWTDEDFSLFVDDYTQRAEHDKQRERSTRVNGVWGPNSR
ncbi:hypothetical protein C8R44DRAFT_656478 [Mycena epipterygia]|nr:hypothetical protein C8R44DRAFT_656478 [Mycena epipterygia]